MNFDKVIDDLVVCYDVAVAEELFDEESREALGQAIDKLLSINERESELK